MSRFPYIPNYCRRLTEDFADPHSGFQSIFYRVVLQHMGEKGVVRRQPSGRLCSTLLVIVVHYSRPFACALWLVVFCVRIVTVLPSI